MKHPVARTHNGVKVYVDLVKSQAAAHIAAQPHLLGLVKEVLQQTNVTTDEMRIEQHMGRDIGYDYVTETTDKDTVFYAQLVHQDTFIPFVKNGKPHSSPYLTIIVQRDDEGAYELYDTWVGRLSPPLPGSSEETPASRPYWANHAHVFDRQPLQLRTVTKICPY